MNEKFKSEAISLPIETRTYKLTGKSRFLGSQPENPQIRQDWIASKAPAEVDTTDEQSALPQFDDSKGMTVFLRNPADGCLCLAGYVIKGFLKESIYNLKDVLGVKSPKSKIDNYVTITDRFVSFYRKDGRPIKDEVDRETGEMIWGHDDVLERPLRAETMQGPRVALAASEMLSEDWTLTFTVALMTNGNQKTKGIGWEAIETALEYGGLVKGLGQWRNAGNGQFTWERLA